MPTQTEAEWNQARLAKIKALQKAGSPKDARAIRIMIGVDDSMAGMVYD